MKKLLVLVLALLLSLPVLAHSGRTDSKGGHNGPGGYHYHHGYPAHQHEGGQCPYDFDDRTGESSGTSSSGSSSSSSSSDSSAKLKNDGLPPWAWIIIVILAIPAMYLIPFLFGLGMFVFAAICAAISIAFKSIGKFLKKLFRRKK